VEEVLATVAAETPVSDIDTQRVTAAIDGGAEELTTVVRLLDERDIALDDIGLRRPSLDEVFLNLTGQALSSTESDGSDVSDAARTDTAVRSRQELR
jgi:ABC-2 type transport system ATP-binding protein